MAFGTSSEMIPSRLGTNSVVNRVAPVTLPPGRLRAGDEAVLDRVAAGLEHDRNGRGRRLGGKRRGRAAGGGDDGDLAAHEFCGQRGQAIVVIIRPAIIDRDVLAFGVAGFGETLMEAGQIGLHAFRRSSVEKPDHRHLAVAHARQAAKKPNLPPRRREPR